MLLLARTALVVADVRAPLFPGLPIALTLSRRLPGSAKRLPDPQHFAYTFDHYAAIMHHWTEALGLARYTLYTQDDAARGFSHGRGPSGPDRGAHRPERCGVQRRPGGAWQTRGPFGPTARPRSALRTSPVPAATRTAHVGTIPTWNAMTRISGRMNGHSQSTRRQRSKAIFFTTTARMSMPIRHAAWMPRSSRAFSSFGQVRPVFLALRPEAYRRDVPKAEVHVLDAAISRSIPPRIRGGAGPRLHDVVALSPMGGKLYVENRMIVAVFWECAAITSAAAMLPVRRKSSTHPEQRSKTLS